MTVETATHISGLNATLPTGADAKAEGDDHIRLLKSTILATFPGMTGAMTGTHTQLNKLVSTFSISSASANAVAIDSSGRVGINGTTPAALLDVGGNTSSGLQAILSRGNDANFQLQVLNGTAGGSGTVQHTVGMVYSGSGESAALRFLRGSGATDGTITIATDNVERVRINASGTVLAIAGGAPSLTTNNTMVFSLTSDTSLRIAVRGSDGVTRAANIALA